jgi:RNA polymerase sigma-70 factor (ECF subfamily)
MQIEQFKTDIISLRQKLFLFALKYLQNEEDAEDAVQETLLRLWKIRDQLDTVANLGAFSMQTLKNICIDRLRTAKEYTEINDFYQVTDYNTPYSVMEVKDMVALVKKIIANLPELQRIIIQMRDVEGYELQEIADITGTQVGAVTVNLSRARKKVRDTLIKITNYKLGITNYG